MRTQVDLKKLIVTLLAGLLLVMFYVPSAIACEIEIVVEGGEKSNYQVSDTVVLQINVFLTHRNCPEGIDATKYKLEGLKALGATQWKQVSADTFQRRIKIQITEGGKPTFHAVRTCDKEGGHGTYIFNISN